jgi:hypothetical protein
MKHWVYYRLKEVDFDELKLAMRTRLNCNTYIWEVWLSTQDAQDIEQGRCMMHLID